jgi:hypothetical protein
MEKTEEAKLKLSLNSTLWSFIVWIENHCRKYRLVDSFITQPIYSLTNSSRYTVHDPVMCADRRSDLDVVIKCIQPHPCTVSKPVVQPVLINFTK